MQPSSPMEASDANEARRNFHDQAGYCRELGSPFTAELCDLLGSRLDHSSRFGRRVLNWPGHARADALALRAAGAFNALARSGQVPALQEVYPPKQGDREALWHALARTIVSHDAFLHDYLDSAPQTNEVRRSSALLGGGLTIAREFGLPLSLLEIGASAGLNLGFEHYRYELGTAAYGQAGSGVVICSEWRGSAPELTTPLAVVTRRACDLNPLDAASDRDRQRVLSYIWPDQSARVETTEAAFDFAAGMPWRVEQGDAATWVEARLAEPTEAGLTRVLMHSIMWQYMPEATKERITGAMRKAGEAASLERPLAWLRMEADGRKEGAAVTLTTWPTGTDREIARADFHGRWVAWS
ncbi:DUF2332 domain-containing protein [Bosea vaviloviae]|nr:DUF2332 family protein [Bosea vaviloviae]